MRYFETKIPRGQSKPACNNVYSTSSKYDLGFWDYFDGVLELYATMAKAVWDDGSENLL